MKKLQEHNNNNKIDNEGEVYRADSYVKHENSNINHTQSIKEGDIPPLDSQTLIERQERAESIESNNNNQDPRHHQQSTISE